MKSRCNFQSDQVSAAVAAVGDSIGQSGNGPGFSAVNLFPCGGFESVGSGFGDEEFPAFADDQEVAIGEYQAPGADVFLGPDEFSRFGFNTIEGCFIGCVAIDAIKVTFMMDGGIELSFQQFIFPDFAWFVLSEVEQGGT